MLRLHPIVSELMCDKNARLLAPCTLQMLCYKTKKESMVENPNSL